MARLTRTQKYADLREQISHDREESLETQELNKYQEKLNDVKSQFGSTAEPVFRNEPVVNKPVELKETISDKVAETEKESMKSLDDILSDMMSETFDVPPVQPIEDIIPGLVIILRCRKVSDIFKCIFLLICFASDLKFSNTIMPFSLFWSL